LEVVFKILKETGQKKVNIMEHPYGGVLVSGYASKNSNRVNKMILFSSMPMGKKYAGVTPDSIGKKDKLDERKSKHWD
jgi:hypothetical protein